MSQIRRVRGHSLYKKMFLINASYLVLIMKVYGVFIALVFIVGVLVSVPFDCS